MLLSHISALFYIKSPTIQIPVPALYINVALPHVIINIFHIAVDTLLTHVGDSICSLFSSLLYSSSSTNDVMKKGIIQLDYCKFQIYIDAR